MNLRQDSLATLTNSQPCSNSNRLSSQNYRFSQNKVRNVHCALVQFTDGEHGLTDAKSLQIPLAEWTRLQEFMKR